MSIKIRVICLLLLSIILSSCNLLEEDNNEPNKYSSLFSRGGYYICYDGIHYKYACNSSDTVREIIKYYYLDCFDVIVYEPGSPETGYLNTLYYATWKSYLSEVEIK